MKAELRGTTTTTAAAAAARLSLPIPSPNSFFNAATTPRGPIPGGGGSGGASLNGCLGSLDGACTEKLILHCAGALERNDVTLAQQVMWVLNNVAAASGDPNQRLTSWFLRALVSRTSRVCPTAMAFHHNSPVAATTAGSPSRPTTVTELAGYVDLLPWHRFGFCASNGAIRRAVRGRRRVHILDLSITHCMQWPTLIDELAKQPGGAPAIRLTVPSARPPVPPSLAISIEEVGVRLTNFAKSRDVPFEFRVIEPAHSGGGAPVEWFPAQLDPSQLHLREDEALVVNCQSWLRYLPSAAKDAFLEAVKGLDPLLVTVADEDADLDSPSLAARIAACFGYLWMPFDALETFLPRDSRRRAEYEADVGRKIEDVVGSGSAGRIERPETRRRLAERMKWARFHGVPFGEDTIGEVKFLLDEHAGGWGMKRGEDGMLVLTWKGHNSVFASAWSPSRPDDGDDDEFEVSVSGVKLI